jgi:hypothetical protein
MRVLQERGGRLYFHNGGSPHWMAVSRPDAADPARELGELIFFDTRRVGLKQKFSFSYLRANLFSLFAFKTNRTTVLSSVHHALQSCQIRMVLQNKSDNSNGQCPLEMH